VGPAIFRKWSSVNKERVGVALAARPYMIIDDCIRKFMLQPKSQHHLYEIHTAPHSDLVSTILSAKLVIELREAKGGLSRKMRTGRYFGIRCSTSVVGRQVNANSLGESL